MNRYNLIGLISLLTLVTALSIYTFSEPGRMQSRMLALRERYVYEGSLLYLDYCSYCHGTGGQGIGATPTLASLSLQEADHTALFKIISRAEHGSAMAAWHIEEGGTLNDYQINELVSLIRFGDWGKVQVLAEVRHIEEPKPEDLAVAVDYLYSLNPDDPHQCSSCHEEPEVHIGRFGLDCARCHGTEAWAPALLTRHIFFLDHGGKGNVACETCHTENYYTHTCYECHDHQPEDMETVHVTEGIEQYENCAACHPTGRPDEARLLMEAQVMGFVGR